MKSSILTTLALLTILTVVAQTSENQSNPSNNISNIFYGDRIGAGTVIGEFNFSFTSENSGTGSIDGDPVTNFRASFTSLFGTSRRFAIGLGIGYSDNPFIPVGASSVIEPRIFTIAPTGRILFPTAFGFVQPHLQIQVPFGFGSGEIPSQTGPGGGLTTEQEVDISSYEVNLSFGTSIYLGPRYGLEIRSGVARFYQQTLSTDEIDDDYKYEIIELTMLSSGLTVGFNYLLSPIEPGDQ